MILLFSAEHNLLQFHNKNNKHGMTSSGDFVNTGGVQIFILEYAYFLHKYEYSYGRYCWPNMNMKRIFGAFPVCWNFSTIWMCG